MTTRGLRCVHIAKDELPLHSTLVWTTVERAKNTTSYEWNEVLMLCPFCAGLVRGLMSSEHGLKLEKIE